MKREIPLIITTVAGLAFAISYFIPHSPFGEFENMFGEWIGIIQAFAIWLGAINLLKVSLEKIQRKKDAPIYPIVIIVSLLVTLGIGFYDGYQGLNAEQIYSFRDPGTNFDWVYVNIYTPLTSTMFSMLAFFVASASYRAFRARNFDATLLLIAGFFVMGGRVPLFDLFSGMFTDYPIFTEISDYIMTNFNTAGQRAIGIGIALGTMSSSLRIILGIERSHIGGA